MQLVLNDVVLCLVFGCDLDLLEYLFEVMMTECLRAQYNSTPILIRQE